MRSLKRRYPAAAAVAVFTLAAPAWSADHRDSPSVIADPSADIADVFAWSAADGNRVNLVMTVGRAVAEDFQFSDHVQYVFHTQSAASFGASEAPAVNIICEFDASQTASCWAGANEYVTGDASNAAGITSSSGAFRVFAGQRNDPFFFNLDGFNHTVAVVDSVEASLTFDDNGCPLLDDATAATLRTLLQSNADGTGPATDTFASSNILAIAVSIDKSILTSGGPILSVWGSTHAR
ncbi:MAG: DUF4331 family protein [bacterium]